MAEDPGGAVTRTDGTQDGRYGTNRPIGRSRHQGARTIVAIGLSLLFLITACGSDDAGEADASATDEEFSLRIARASSSLGVGPAIVAEAAGLYEEDGITAETQVFEGSSANTLAALVGGDVDIAILGTPGLLDASLQGVDVRLVAGVTDFNGQLVLRSDVADRLEAESGVTPTSSVAERVDALEGLTLATSASGSALHSFLSYILAEEGSAGVEAELVPAPDPVSLQSGLREGRMDGGMWGVGGLTPVIVDGTAVEWTAGGDLADLEQAPQAIVMARGDYVDEHPDRVERIQAVFAEAVARAADPSTEGDVKEAVRLEFFPDLDPEVFDAQWAASTPTWAEGATVSEEGLDLYKQVQTLQTENDYSVVVYDDVVIDAAKR